MEELERLVGRLDGRMDARMDAQDKILVEIRDHVKETNGRVTTLEKSRIADQAVAAERERLRLERQTELEHKAIAAERKATEVDRKLLRREWKVGAVIAVASALVAIGANFALHYATPTSPNSNPPAHSAPKQVALAPKSRSGAPSHKKSIIRSPHGPHAKAVMHKTHRTVSAPHHAAPKAVSRPHRVVHAPAPHSAPASSSPHQPVQSATGPTRSAVAGAIHDTGSAVANTVAPVSPPVANATTKAADAVAQVVDSLPPH